MSGVVDLSWNAPGVGCLTHKKRVSGSHMMPNFGRNYCLDTGIRGQHDPGKDAIFYLI